MTVRVIRIAAVLLAASILPIPVSASEPPTEFSAPMATDANTLAFELLPPRFRPRVSGPARQWTSETARAHRRYAESLVAPDYRDRAPLVTRLRELNGLSLVTFWDARAFTVFFGVSRDGFAGLNIAQKTDRLGGSDDDEDEPAEDPAPEPTFLAATAYRE